ncbi:EAL domain-containing protein [Thioalkalicoccus limnaeus]|uniref:EAL domain-containing protein n=1 Tax=Thioalkalicoccus limnaeus TaxID=120681 RepID=A0ABV4BE65_9GAMM
MSREPATAPAPTKGKPLGPAWVAVLYGLAGGAWIAASGYALGLMIEDPVLLERLELGKGLLFVVTTACLLYLLLRLRQTDPAEALGAPAEPVMRGAWLAAILAMLLLLAPLLAVSIVKLRGPAVEREALAELSVIAELKTDHLRYWLTERLGDGLAIAADDDLRDRILALQAAAARPGEVGARLEAIRRAHGYDAVVLLSADGRPLLVLGDIREPDRAADDPHLAELAAGRTAVVNLFRDPLGRLHLDVALSISAPGSARPDAYLVLHVDPDHFLLPFIQYWPTASPSGETLLVRRDGDSIVFLNPLRHQPGEALTFRLPLDTPGLPAAVAIGRDRPGTIRGRDYRGVPVLAAYRPVPGTDWHLVAKRDQREILAPVQHLALLVGVLTLFATLAIAVMLVLLWRQQQRTLQLALLAQTAERDRLLSHFYELPFIGMAITDPATKRWLHVNARLAEILGRSREELAALSWAEITHPEDLAADVAAFDRVVGGESDGYRMDKRFVRPDGVLVYAAIDVRCVRHPDGTLAYFVATVDDVTERRRSEIALRRQRDLYDMLSQTNQAIVRTVARDALLIEICRIAVQHGRFLFAWVGWLGTAPAPPQAVAQYGTDAGFLAAFLGTAPAGQEHLGRAIASGRHAICNDLLAEAVGLPWYEPARQAGFRAAGAFLLHHQGEVVGLLGLYAGEGGFFTAEVVETLDEMMRDVSFALDNLAQTQALKDSEARYHSLFANDHTPMLLVDSEDGAIVDANPAAGAYYGYPSERLRGAAVALLDTRDPQGCPVTEASAWLDRGSHFEARQQLADGQVRDVELHVAPVGVAGRTLLYCIVHDLTTRKQAEEAQRLAAAVFKFTRDGVVITDLVPRILAVNRAYTEITGYAADEVQGRNPAVISSGRHDAAFYQGIWTTLAESGHWQGEIWNRRKGGEIYPAWLTISTVHDERGVPSHYVGVFTDISQLKQSEARLESLAHYDTLTGLPNRRLVQSRLEQALARATRHGQRVGVLFVDLDRFKNINDSLGHPAGDELLKAISERLTKRIREEDTLARLGGDEFLLLIESLALPEDAAVVAEMIIRLVEQPFLLDGRHEVYIGASVGISLYPDDALDVTALIQHADAAMYQAKEQGRNTYRFYTKTLTEWANRRLELETQLRQALEREEFLLHYQPIVAAADGRLIGLEALVRWQPPGVDLVSPSDFIPICEDTGLIVPLGDWVLHRACAQLKTWLDGGCRPVCMAINLSVRQLRFQDMVRQIQAILHLTGIPPHLIQLELTESGIMEQGEKAITIMGDLKAMGVRLAIDDFGTGYSSLAHLKRFRVDRLKVDRSFVQNLDKDDNDRQIATTIIAMAHNLRLDVVAEGVETRAQQEWLARMGCDAFQGYLFARPMTAEAVWNWVRRQRPPGEG